MLVRFFPYMAGACPGGGAKGPAPPPLEIKKQKKRLQILGPPPPFRIPRHAPVWRLKFLCKTVLTNRNAAL